MPPRLKVPALLTLLCLGLGAGVLWAQTQPDRDWLERLPVITTIAYITAHPDDESGAVISYFARGLKARVVILCLTRGEGGQNTYGPELGEELGRLRTRELEAAARAYGAEVRFLDALDFGYSKSVEETLLVWEHEAVLERLVRALRELQPDVVIARWTPEAPAGAHHQAAGLLAREAYALIGDPAAYPEHLSQGLSPWPARYLISHARGSEEGENIGVSVDELDADTGKSYEDIGWEGFRQHRSQGLDRIPREGFRGRSYFLHVDALRLAAPMPRRAQDLVQQLDALPIVFPRVGILPAWQERLAEVDQLARAAARVTPADAAAKLISGAEVLAELQAELAEEPSAAAARAVVESRQTAFLHGAAKLAGIEVRAVADRARAVPGERFRLRLSARRGASNGMARPPMQVTEVQLAAPADWLTEAVMKESSENGLVLEYAVSVPASARPGPLPLTASAVIATRNLPFALPAALRGPQGEPLRVVSRIQLSLEPPLRLVPTTLAGGLLDWEVRGERHAATDEPVEVQLEVPPGWTPPLPRSAQGRAAGSFRLRFQVLLPERLEPGSISLQGQAAGAEPAAARAQVVEVTVPRNLRIGYIGFNNDPVPPLLAQLGIGVDMLDEETLADTKLDAYDAVIVAERAYDFREDLAEETKRLLAYVEQGGTLLVE
ncbi:MAG: PIG-L family deacetylase, partial [Acidobacteria bacterium]|nr:PIG-L family deacetylase [Acidobacteriota bacterium]